MKRLSFKVLSYSNDIPIVQNVLLSLLAFLSLLLNILLGNSQEWQFFIPEAGFGHGYLAR